LLLAGAFDRQLQVQPLARFAAAPEQLLTAAPHIRSERFHLLDRGLVAGRFEDPEIFTVDGPRDSPSEGVEDRTRAARSRIRGRRQRLRLCRLPLLRGDLLLTMDQQVRTEHAAHDDVGQLVAVDVLDFFSDL
jgi:hypothetical protein